MADYKIILDGLDSFGVEITAPDGFRSVRGFPTEAAAFAVGRRTDRPRGKR
jgi:hypothetical protein